MKEETIVSNWNEKGLRVFLKRRPKNEDLRPKTPLTKTKTLWTKTKTPLTKTKTLWTKMKTHLTKTKTLWTKTKTPLTKTKTPWTKTKTLWTKTKTPLTKTKTPWKRRPLWQKRRPFPSPHFHFLALVSFLARPKPRIPFLGLFLLRNQTETLVTQAIQKKNVVVEEIKEFELRSRLGKFIYNRTYNSIGLN